jgi:CheY-like chemotaxis protein
MRVLVVDDEPRYRVYLRARLSEAGYEVAVAASGREAIDRGIHFRPEVLVTDWMLKNHLHGLHVANVLGTVTPGTRTVLMTGFASDDLRSQASAAHVEFLEKPFAPDDLVSVIESTPVVPVYLRPRVPFGVIAAAANGLIVHTSPRAGSMLASVDAHQPHKLQGLFGDGVLSRIDGWCDDFERVAPIAPKRVRWWVGARRLPDGILLVLLPERKRFLRIDSRVLLLLGRPLPQALRQHGDLHVMVIDDAPIDRTTYVGRLEAIGCVCYKAESRGLALDLLRAEPAIDVVVIDMATAGADLDPLVRDLRATAPGLTLVGVSHEMGGQLQAAAGGVDRFLSKPWSVGDLIHVLTH